jgi:hypothetical protein
MEIASLEFDHYTAWHTAFHGHAKSCVFGQPVIATNTGHDPANR